MRLRPSQIDEPAIRECLGVRSVRTLPELAAEFGVAATTLRSNWRQQGMPGKPGTWPLAEILIWRLKHEAAIAQKKLAPPDTPAFERQVRLDQIEIEKAEADLRKRLREEAKDEGKLIDRESVVAGTSAIFAVQQEMLKTVGPQIEPMLPLKVAKPASAEITRVITNIMTAVSEMSARDLLKHASK